jgi:hypothetical protein
MSKKEFEEFLNKNSLEEKPVKPIDWEGIKEEWLKQLNILYSNVSDWLNEYINRGQISINYRDIQMNESAMGYYTAKIMEIHFGGKVVRLIPVARLIIGGNGRVDLEGSNSKVIRFILTDEKSTGIKIEVRFGSDKSLEKEDRKEEKQPAKLVWKIATQPPQIKYMKLDEDSFFTCLMQVTNGQKG